MPKWSPAGQHILSHSSNGIVICSLATREVRKVLSRPVLQAQWLQDGKRIFFVERDRLGILDLDSGREVTAPLPAVPGARIDFSISLSNDGSTLYLVQILEHGDIWFARFNQQ